MAQDVVVVGCGVIGLTSAIRLQEQGFAVRIITRDLPPNLTSAAAGAYWYGGELAQHPARHRWSFASLEEYLRLAKGDYCGVSLFKMLEVFPHPVSDPWFKDQLPSFRRASASEIPSGYADGYWMEIPIVEPPRYLHYLVDRFCSAGGQIEQRALNTLTDLTPDHALIVNCTGVYARQVANDPTVYPLRGQTVIVDAPHVHDAYMNDATFTYILPRPDGCVLGGVSQPDNWSLDVNPADREHILRQCEQVEPSLRGATIVGETVGLRPGRHAVRLEREQIGSAIVIHNYGHGGLGFTLSWGCAADVEELAEGG
jgi:D-amino-acid oxidase